MCAGDVRDVAYRLLSIACRSSLLSGVGHFQESAILFTSTLAYRAKRLPSRVCPCMAGLSSLPPDKLDQVDRLGVEPLQRFGGGLVYIDGPL